VPLRNVHLRSVVKEADRLLILAMPVIYIVNDTVIKSVSLFLPFRVQTAFTDTKGTLTALMLHAELLYILVIRLRNKYRPKYTLCPRKRPPFYFSNNSVTN